MLTKHDCHSEYMRWPCRVSMRNPLAIMCLALLLVAFHRREIPHPTAFSYPLVRNDNTIFNYHSGNYRNFLRPFFGIFCLIMTCFFAFWTELKIIKTNTINTIKGITNINTPIFLFCGCSFPRSTKPPQ